MHTVERKSFKKSHTSAFDYEVKEEETPTEEKNSVKAEISCLKCSVNFEKSQQMINHIESSHSSEYEFFCNEFSNQNNCLAICLGIEEFKSHLEKEHSFT